MTETRIEKKIHPTDVEVADYLSGSLTAEARRRIEEHIAGCGDCLAKLVSAHESVKLFNKNLVTKKGKDNPMKRINLYLVVAIIAFALSFVMSRYFIQLLVVTQHLGAKWIVDSKSTKMLIAIYEGWKRGGEKEASRILDAIDSKSKKRF